MEEKTKIIPYIVTIYGTIRSNREDLSDMQDELTNTDIQTLINNADSKFVELNEPEFHRMEELPNEQ